jgi:hypothetical protein
MIGVRRCLCLQTFHFPMRGPSSEEETTRGTEDDCNPGYVNDLLPSSPRLDGSLQSLLLMVCPCCVLLTTPSLDSFSAEDAEGAG